MPKNRWFPRSLTPPLVEGLGCTPHAGWTLQPARTFGFTERQARATPSSKRAQHCVLRDGWLGTLSMASMCLLIPVVTHLTLSSRLPLPPCAPQRVQSPTHCTLGIPQERESHAALD